MPWVRCRACGRRAFNPKEGYARMSGRQHARRAHEVDRPELGRDYVLE